MSTHHLSTPIRQSISNATKLCQRALKGRELAEILECTESNISHSITTGHGDICRIIDLISALRLHVIQNINYDDSTAALRNLISLICQTAGAQPFYPSVVKQNDIAEVLQAAKMTMKYTSELIGNIQDAIDDYSPDGNEISNDEAGKIGRAADSVIEVMLELKDFISKKDGKANGKPASKTDTKEFRSSNSKPTVDKAFITRVAG